MFSSIVARARIDPRMGPIQGVQPNAKAAPTSTGKARLWLYRSVKILISLFINLKLMIPIIWNEKNIIITPAIILKILELVKKKFPINVAVEPKTIKTKEKPKVKKIVLMTTKFLCFLTNLSKDVPEIYAIYPGIKGRTQGDKKLINPAKKAIGNVAFIKYYVAGLFIFLLICRLMKDIATPATKAKKIDESP